MLLHFLGEELLDGGGSRGGAIVRSGDTEEYENKCDIVLAPQTGRENSESDYKKSFHHLILK